MELLWTGLRRALPFRTKTEYKTMQQFQAILWLLEKLAQSRGRAGIGRPSLMHISESGHTAEKERKTQVGRKV